MFTTTKARVPIARRLAISCDEMTTIDTESWVNIHAYLVDGFKLILILVDLERLVDGGTTNNLTNVILNSLMVLWGPNYGRDKWKVYMFSF
jgi:hypothetical protein